MNTQEKVFRLISHSKIAKCKCSAHPYKLLSSVFSFVPLLPCHLLKGRHFCQHAQFCGHSANCWPSVCLCVLWWIWPSTNTLSHREKKKRPVNCNKSFPIGWDSHFQENFCHYWRVCEPFVEALSEKLWQEGSRLQLVTEVSQTSSLSVTTAPSPPSLFFFAVSHPSHLPNRDKHFPNEGVGWESCGEWSVDVTSGIVGHLLFMGRGHRLWKCVLTQTHLKVLLWCCIYCVTKWSHIHV